jgi:hypothetical protein
MAVDDRLPEFEEGLVRIYVDKIAQLAVEANNGATVTQKIPNLVDEAARHFAAVRSSTEMGNLKRFAGQLHARAEATHASQPQYRATFQQAKTFVDILLDTKNGKDRATPPIQSASAEGWVQNKESVAELPNNFRQALAIRCALRAIPLLGKWGNFAFWKDTETASRHVANISRAIQAGLVNCTSNVTRHTDELARAMEAVRSAAQLAARDVTTNRPEAAGVIQIVALAVDAGKPEHIDDLMTLLSRHKLLYAGAGNAALVDFERLREYANQSMNWPPPQFFRLKLWAGEETREWRSDRAAWLAALDALGLANVKEDYIKWSSAGIEPSMVGASITELVDWLRLIEVQQPVDESEETEPKSEPISTQKSPSSGNGFPRSLLTFSKTAEQTLHRAADLADRSKRAGATSSCLLFALAEGAGQQNDTCRFIRDLMRRSGRYQEEFERFLSDSGNAKRQAELESGTALGRVSKNVMGILEDAALVARRVSKTSAEIHQRHLLASLIVTSTKKRNPVAWNRLKRLELELPDVRGAFLTYVQQHVGMEDFAEWRAILSGAVELSADFRPQNAESATDVPELPKSEELPPTEDVGRIQVRVGARNNFLRNATGDEIVLGVHGYAQVLTSLLRASDDKDLCIAIFGPWGRGKTFLMDRVVEKLKESNESTDRTYEVVKFSAWKFPSRPEVWIHLYESVFRQLRRYGWWKSLAHVVRAGIERHGVGKLVAIWSALFITAFPKGWLFEGVDVYFRKYLYTIDGSLAVASAIFAILFVYKLWKTKEVLEASFVRVARHVEKLGLQATIGDDLRALLKGWVDVPRDWGRRHYGWRWFAAAVALLVGAIEIRAGAAWQLGLVFSTVVIAAAVLVRVAFLKAAKSPDRLLLIVDDLDRCQFEHLLAVMESIKLLLEDEEISRRIQVVMLIEEDVLKHAVWEKYKKLTEKLVQKELETRYDGRRIVRENLDKLFTAHLRLAPLTLAEISDVVLAFGGRDKKSASSSRSPDGKIDEPIAPTSTEPGPPSSVMNQDVPILSEHLQPQATSVPQRAEAILVPSDPVRTREQDERTVISPDEKEIILSALRDVYGDSHTELGPRALRAFMFRYQLARLILEELGDKDWKPHDLAQMIASKQFAAGGAHALPKSASPNISMVSSQVA